MRLGTMAKNIIIHAVLASEERSGRERKGRGRIASPSLIWGRHSQAHDVLLRATFRPTINLSSNPKKGRQTAFVESGDARSDIQGEPE